MCYGVWNGTFRYLRLMRCLSLTVQLSRYLSPVSHHEGSTQATYICHSLTLLINILLSMSYLCFSLFLSQKTEIFSLFSSSLSNSLFQILAITSSLIFGSPMQYFAVHMILQYIWFCRTYNFVVHIIL